ncbi:8860_t:CDS:2, partial [Funneliformis geosporum]
FIKASELLNSKNDTAILDELKDKFTHMQNAQLTEIYEETSKSFNSKEIYDRPYFSRFKEFVKSTQPDIDLLTLYDKKVIVMLLSDPLTDEEMIQIFEHPNMSNNTSDGLLRRVFLWIRCCTARKDENGIYGTCYNIKKYLNLRPKNAKENLFLHINKNLKDIENGNWYSTSHMGRDKLYGMLKEICNITGIDCINRRIVNHSLRKYTDQKLNDEGLDSQAIMNITLHRSLAGLNENFNIKESNKKELNIKGDDNAKLISNKISKEEINISETEKEPFSEIQNMVPSKRKNDLFLNNSRLKFINCSNITINIAK